ncbi:MAG: hypothetical protein ACRDHZ_06020 [Ktedonobacteraceae bacterium]
MQDKYIPASEAIELSGLPSATFYRYANEGKIRKHYPSSASKHAMYSHREAASLRNKFKRDTTTAEASSSDWIKSGDVGNMYNLEYREYGDETGDPSIVRKWYDRNPYICRILFNKADRRDFWGAINMLPLEEETIYKLLKGELRDVDLDPQKDILTFDDPGEYNFYVASVIIAPERKQHFPMLINGLFDFWVEQAPERTLRRIYGRVVSEGGELMAKKLFFSPRWDISDTAFMLDMKRPNPSRLIQGFQYAIKQKSEM